MDPTEQSVTVLGDELVSSEISLDGLMLIRDLSEVRMVNDHIHTKGLGSILTERIGALRTPTGDELQGVSVLRPEEIYEDVNLPSVVQRIATSATDDSGTKTIRDHRVYYNSMVPEMFMPGDLFDLDHWA
jgi:hypothetical protein